MNILSRSIKYLLRYKWYIIGAFIMMIFVTAFSLAVPKLIQKIIDEGIILKDISVIKQVAIILIVITIAKAFSSFFQTYWSQTASQSIAYDLRNDLFEKLEYFDFSFHDKHNIGQLLTRTTNDVEGVRNFYATGILQILSAVFTLIGSIVILVNTEWKLFLLVFIVMPFIAYIFVTMFAKMIPMFIKIQRNKGLLNNLLQENILGVRVIKGFTAEKEEHKRYTKQNQIIYDENLKKIYTFANGFPIVFFLSNIATIIVLFFGGNQVIASEMSIGTLIAFNSYLAFLIQPIFQLGMVLQQLSKASASTNRIFDILDAENNIVSPPNAVIFNPKETHTIKFSDVSFSYINSEDELELENINLVIEAGSNTAIIGKTGSGKSTLVNLIPRFYDTLEGSVSINGTNVKEFELESLRQNIGVVLQEIRLLNGTIKENIIYGKPNATKEEIDKVCVTAQIDTFLDKFDEGLDFQVGEGGINLSGGQRQRIAIARMLLVEPKILILDDATSSLDGNTERNLINDAEPYLNSKEHTVIIISQKINTIRNVDKIVVMKDGNIVAQGTHDELIKNSIDYIELVNQKEQ